MTLRSKKTKHVVVKQAKSTKVQIYQRVSEVQALLLEGHTRSQIVQYGSKWKISDRQIDDYIAQANAIIKEINLVTAQDNLAIITRNLWDLYRTSKAGGNLSVARQVAMDIAKLRGLDQSTINHVIEDKRDLEDLSNEELDKMLEVGSNDLQ